MRWRSWCCGFFSSGIGRGGGGMERGNSRFERGMVVGNHRIDMEGEFDCVWVSASSFSRLSECWHHQSKGNVLAALNTFAERFGW